MNPTLVPCSACARHVRHPASSCPFCGSRIEVGARQARVVPRMGRAAMVAFGATALLAACGGGGAAAADQTTEPHVTAGDESGNSGGHGEDPNAVHDPEGSDGVHEDTTSQPHPDEGAPVAAYGAPAPDSVTPE
jgi:hypothetical protein